VVVADAAGYESCSPGAGSSVYSTGQERIPLKKGDNYFLCNYPGHCEQGMKIAVTAA